MLTKSQLNKVFTFQTTVWDFYSVRKRDLPWRRPDKDGNLDPYKILVSEVMLQQTQVNRVIPKYKEFLQTFPTIQSLAKAGLADVLLVWSGLGYNRRAKFLHLAAQRVTKEYGGHLPYDSLALTALPGIGKNTAGAIMAYSFNKPVVFIETNVRSVFLYHFFPGKSEVTDRQLLPYIEASLDVLHPREWYWALMDYGSYLKKVEPGLQRASKHFVIQTTFEGSKRQIRGRIIRELSSGSKTHEELIDIVRDGRLDGVLKELESESLIKRFSKKYRLGK